MFQGIMLNKMQKLANNVTSDVIASYEKQKSLYPNLNEADMLYLSLCDAGGLDKTKIPQELENKVKNRFCTSLEGVCYILGLEFGFLNGSMAMRCAQYTAMVDRFLTAKGYKPTSKEIKIRLYKELDLYETYKSAPSLFN
jgi:hypothetical protein